MIMRPPLASRRPHGLSLMELMLAMAIFSVVMLTIMSAVTMLQGTWTRLRGTADTYRGARLALDAVARKVSQCMIQPRYEAPLETEAVRDSTLPFVRRSDLHFVCGPATNVAPLNGTCGHAIFFVGPYGEPAQAVTRSAPRAIEHESLHELMSGWGYFVQLRDATQSPPDFLGKDAATQKGSILTGVPQRFRLMEMRQPADELSIFKPANDSTQGAPDATVPHAWFRDPLLNGTPNLPRLRVVADNILALIVIPLTGVDAKGPASDQLNSGWDTRDHSSPEQHHRHAKAYRLTVIATPEDYWHGTKVVSPVELQGQINGLFNVPARYANDLQLLTSGLVAKRVPHRVMSTIVRPPSS
jgi:uncharacterized protein (TIGR02599 family)